jgi:hypothetical protein
MSCVRKNFCSRNKIIFLESHYQQGVPTKVFLARCLSPDSKRQAETPKSPSLTPPRESTRIFPACGQKEEKKMNSNITCLERVNQNNIYEFASNINVALSRREYQILLIHMNTVRSKMCI